MLCRPQRIQIFNVGSRHCRRKQNEDIREGIVISIQDRFKEKLNKDLSIKFNGIIQDTGHVDNDRSLLVLFLRQRERCSISAY